MTDYVTISTTTNRNEITIDDGVDAGTFPDGTVSIPAIAFTSDADTGLYRPGADQIGFTAGGVKRALLSSSSLTLDVTMSGTSANFSGNIAAAGATILGNITTTGTVDGRDVSADGTKLDGIEAGADVTDTANVTAAGALMDSEVDADLKTLTLPANTTISTFGASLVDDANASAAQTTLGLGTAATEDVQTSPTDTTAGAVLTVGAFGLGDKIRTITDYNDPISNGVTGFARWASGGTANAPASFTNVLTLADFNGIGSQISTSISSTNPQMWLRGQGSVGSPGPWAEVWTDHNLTPLDATNNLSDVSDPDAAIQNLKTARVYETRSDFETAVAGGLSLPDGWLVAADGLFYKADSTSTAISDLPGYVPWGDIYIDHFGENTTPKTTDMTSAINAADAYVSSVLGGGKIHLRYTGYATTGGHTPSRAIMWVGQGFFVNNDYNDGSEDFVGSHFYLITGSNANIFDVLADVSDLISPSFPRHYGGVRDIAFHGNRSTSASKTAVDRNSSGIGIRVRGLSYYEMENVLAWRCAEQGIVTGSYDYGDGEGPRGCNNMHWTNVRAIRCASDGMRLYAGDGVFSDLIAGANGGDGIVSGTDLITNVRCWNNDGRGLVQFNIGTIVNGVCYDNGLAGCEINDPAVGDMETVSLVGCSFYQNGANVDGVDANTCGLELAGAGTYTVILSGCRISNRVRTTQRIGVHCSNPNVTIIDGGNSINSNTVSQLDLASGTILQGPLQDTGTGAVGGPTPSSGLTVLDASEAGAVWRVTAWHTSGTWLATANVLGDATTPLILAETVDDAGTADTIAFAVSGTNIVVYNSNDATNFSTKYTSQRIS